MNLNSSSSSNSTNQSTYFTVDELLTNDVGSTWFLDYFDSYGFAITNALGTALNIRSFSLGQTKPTYRIDEL